jgi:hypothetical protein
MLDSFGGQMGRQESWRQLRSVKLKGAGLIAAFLLQVGDSIYLASSGR